MEYTIFVTTKEGYELIIKGGETGITRIEEILKNAGFKYNTIIETWDEGYYDSTKENEHELQTS